MACSTQSVIWSIRRLRTGANAHSGPSVSMIDGPLSARRRTRPGCRPVNGTIHSERDAVITYT
jgi:hypothetical protein